MRVVLLALGCVCLVLVLLLWRGVRVDTRVRPVIADPAPPPRRLSPPPPKIASSFAPTRPRPRQRNETAHVRGRVVGPPGVEVGALVEDLEVFAEEGDRRYEASLDDDGTFALHLPAGTYRLVARGPEWVGGEERVTVIGTVAVTLVVGRAAKISGVVRGAELEGVSLSVRHGSGQLRDGTIEDDGRFTAGGLVPGEGYDLTFAGEGIREITLTVTAPSDGLEVTLETLPVLRGAVGFDPVDGCPIESVAITDGAGLDDSTSVDDDCRFVASGLPTSRELTITASGGGWHFTELVTTPAHGDPPPLCLNPPCGNRAARATLEVEVTDAPAGPMTAVVQSDHRVWECDGPGSRCEVEVPVGTPLNVFLATPDCDNQNASVTAHAGRNPVSLPCRSMRTIQGVVHYRAGTASPPRFSVRCVGSSEIAPSRGYLFQLRCPLTTAAVELRSADQEPWRQTRLPAEGNLVLVDIDWR